MMMASDSSAGRPELSSESVTQLTTALHRYSSSAEDLAEIQAALRAVAAEARQKQVHAEQLLVLLKDIWYGLPAVRHLPDDGKHQLLQRVVTVCIREYYST